MSKENLSIRQIRFQVRRKVKEHNWDDWGNWQKFWFACYRGHVLGTKLPILTLLLHLREA